jgi:hypothetical protein
MRGRLAACVTLALACAVSVQCSDIDLLEDDLLLTSNIEDEMAKLEVRAKKSRWNATYVVVPAVYEEYDNHDEGAPPELLAVMKARSDFDWIRMQRKDPEAPHYCWNSHTEVGVYLCFVVEFYDDLPDVMIFHHADPFPHNKLFWEWAQVILAPLPGPLLVFNSVHDKRCIPD